MSDLTPGPRVMFRPVNPSRSTKVQCSVCGARGYADDGLNPWQETHLRGHKPCDYCDQMLVVKLDGAPRVHMRCPS